MISMPMNYHGWIEDYIKYRDKLEAQGYKVTPHGIDAIYNSVPEYNYKIQNVPLMYMSNAFARMAVSDTVYFVKGWETARGCIIEHEAAVRYGLNILYEEDEDED